MDVNGNDGPVIIQGGMGAAVSDWRLARAVALTGQLGVVSGTALDTVLARRLQLGDADGSLRRALDMFPFAGMTQRILEKYFVPGGKADSEPFKAIPMLSAEPDREQLELLVVANFVEVYLAREGHTGYVGINYLEKIQLPNFPSMFGAMLAGVDYILMGAGIPVGIPGTLDKLSAGEPVDLPLRIAGGTTRAVRFDSEWFTGGERIKLDRPKFLAIVASTTLATMLTRKANGRVDGFVIEGPTAGGHNAPPRGRLQLTKAGEPKYGQKDVVDLASFRALGAPFWLAGSYGSPEQLNVALREGAAGIQVGTAFAFCRESGLRSDVKQQAIRLAVDGQTNVFTDPVASPTGFPFKILELDETLSGGTKYAQRKRVCDLGYLREGYEKEDGTIGWRCPSEPVSAFLRKGGKACDTEGRKCLCNGLLANVGMPQVRRGQPELALVTCGDDVRYIDRFLPSPGATSYSASDVIEHLMALVPEKV